MIPLLRDLSGVTLPSHLEFIESLIGYALAFVLVIAVMRVVLIFVDRR